MTGHISAGYSFNHAYDNRAVVLAVGTISVYFQSSRVIYNRLWLLESQKLPVWWTRIIREGHQSTSQSSSKTSLPTVSSINRCKVILFRAAKDRRWTRIRAVSSRNFTLEMCVLKQIGWWTHLNLLRQRPLSFMQLQLYLHLFRRTGSQDRWFQNLFSRAPFPCQIGNFSKYIC